MTLGTVACVLTCVFTHRLRSKFLKFAFGLSFGNFPSKGGFLLPFFIWGDVHALRALLRPSERGVRDVFFRFDATFTYIIHSLSAPSPSRSPF